MKKPKKDCTKKKKAKKKTNPFSPDNKRFIEGLLAIDERYNSAAD